MMKKIFKAAILGCMPVLMAASISAQVVTVGDDKITLNVSPSPDTEGEALETDSFSVFGKTDDGYMLVRVGDTDGYVKKDELQAALPGLNCEAYPSLDGLSAVAPEDSAEKVVSLQKDLIAAGVLSGEADGIYGSGTAGAVRKFQAEHGLAETGQADLNTVLALKGTLSGLEDSIEVSSKVYSSPEEKFRQIYDKTNADLEPFMNASWNYQFDQAKESGVIDPGINFGTFEVDYPDVDVISGKVSTKVVIRKKADNTYELIPAIVVETQGAYRPYLQSMVLSGEDSMNIEGASSLGELEGITLKEFGYVPLTAQAIEYLSAGKLESVQALGKNEKYEVQAEYDAEQLKTFMEACKNIAWEQLPDAE